MRYNWQQKDWPKFSFDIQKVEDLLYTYAEKAGRLSGTLDAMSDEAQTEALVNTLVAEAIKTSEIEGEYLSREDVASSIRNNLGILNQTEEIKDIRAKGIADLMLNVRNSYKDNLTEDTLFTWHRMLLSHDTAIALGSWRTHEEPMQVISGAIGREVVHFEAPPSDKVPEEMQSFIKWFNKTSPKEEKAINHAPIRAAITHLYFESIHPFEDGNGRIGRAIAEKALSQTTGYPVLLSLSASIEQNKKAYYKFIEKGQRHNEITDWLIYFIQTIIDAQEASQELIDFTLNKVRFFDQYRDQLNERQLKVIKRMLDEGTKGFEGGMNATKYLRIAKTSKATATRDLQKLIEIGAFKSEGGGRSTRYLVNF